MRITCRTTASKAPLLDGQVHARVNVDVSRRSVRSTLVIAGRTIAITFDFTFAFELANYSL